MTPQFFDRPIAADEYGRHNEFHGDNWGFYGFFEAKNDQDVANALFDALFNILPLATDLDRVDPTPARLHVEILWSDEAKALLDEVLEAHPVLVRISAAKRLRDAAESGARRAGEDRVTTEIVAKARAALMDGQPA